MKIAIDASFLNHSVRSGLLVYSENLIRELACIDSDNEYILIFFSLRKNQEDLPGLETDNVRKRVIRLPDRKYPFRSFITNKIILPHFLEQQRCDIYHALAGYSLPACRKAKMVITIHDLRSVMIPDKTWPQNIKQLKKSACDAHAIITVSEATKGDIVRILNVSPDKIKVIYLSADEDFFPRTDSACEYIRRKYGINEDYLFSLGQVPRKNVERLIKAYSLFRYRNNFLLVVGGAGEKGEWMRAYKEAANTLGVESRVRFIGYLPRQDLPYLYGASRCFVFPSLFEGFGIPVLEAMKCETPVIISNTSSLPEVGGDAALYVDPYNEYDIAHKMEMLVEGDYLRKTMIQKGRSRVNRFSWAYTAKKTIEVYKEVACLD